MTTEKGKAKCGCGCCKVEALITVDERGQMVLPKDVRDKAKIHGGDKLALTTIEKEGEVCCLLLTKADDLVTVVQATLGSVAGEFIPDAAPQREEA